MRNALLLLAAAAVLFGVSPADAQSAKMNVFLASEGSEVERLEDADGHCYELAYRVGAGDLTWRAYLGASGAPAAQARERIGPGPWYNYRGALVAEDAAALRAEGGHLTEETLLTEKGGRLEPGADLGALLPARLETVRDAGAAARFLCFAID